MKTHRKKEFFEIISTFEHAINGTQRGLLLFKIFFVHRSQVVTNPCDAGKGCKKNHAEMIKSIASSRTKSFVQVKQLYDWTVVRIGAMLEYKR